MPSKLQQYLTTIVGTLTTVTLSLISFAFELPREFVWLTFFVGSIITITATLLEQRLLDATSTELNSKLEIYRLFDKIKDPELQQLANDAVTECIYKLQNYAKGTISSPIDAHFYLIERTSKCQRIFQATYWVPRIRTLYNIEDTFVGKKL